MNITPSERETPAGNDDASATPAPAVSARLNGVSTLPSDAPGILLNNLVRVEDTSEIGQAKDNLRRNGLQALIRRYVAQLLYGCGNPTCTNVTCFTCRQNASAGPLRRLTPTSARTIACYLATQDDPEKSLCLTAPELSITQERELSYSPQANVTPEKSSDNDSFGVAPTASTTKKDPKSFTQNLFDTLALRMLEWLPVGLPGEVSSDPPSSSVSVVEHNEVHISNGTKREDESAFHTPSTNGVLPDKTVERKPRHARPSYRTPDSKAASVDTLPEAVDHFSYEIIKALLALQKPASDLLADDEKAFIRQVTLSRARSSCIPNYANRTDTERFMGLSIAHVLSNASSLAKSFNLVKDGDTGSYRRPSSRTLDESFRLLHSHDSELVFNSMYEGLSPLFAPPSELSHSRSPRSSLTNGEYYREKLRQGRAAWNQRSLPSQYISDEEAAHIVILAVHALAAFVPKPEAAVWMNFRGLRKAGKIFNDGNIRLSASEARLVRLVDVFEHEPAQRFANRLIRAIGARKYFAEFTREDDVPGRSRNSLMTIIKNYMKSAWKEDGLQWDGVSTKLGDRPFYTQESGVGWSLPLVTIDWLHGAILREWDGKQTISRFSVVGAAVDLMASLFPQRDALGVPAGHFQTPYFSERLDIMDTAHEWLTAEPSSKNVQLLSHSFLFPTSTLVAYFRALNFFWMSKAFEGAMATSRLIMQMVYYGPFSQNEGSQMHDRLKSASATYLVLDISRENLLQDTWNQLWRRERRELLRPLKVRFGMDEGEEGVDHGGIQQEFFRMALGLLLHPEYGMFKIDSLTQMAWFTPFSTAPMFQFELMGVLVSLALYNGVTLPVTFPLAFYRKLLGQPVEQLDHIKDGWPQLHRGLESLLAWTDGNVEDVFVRSYEFDIDHPPLSIDMQRIGREDTVNIPELTATQGVRESELVSNANREQYVSDYIFWLTDRSVRSSFEAFEKGFYSCFERKAVSVFSAEALQRVVEGIQEIDVAQLEKVTKYEDGYRSSSTTVRNFWSVVRGFTQLQRAKLLEFVTASDRLPVNGVSSVIFVIQKSGGDSDRLPTSLTCFGRLLLPDYETREKLEEKVLLALENGKGFGVP